MENSFITLMSVKLCDCPSPTDADTMIELFGKIEYCQLVLLPHQTVCTSLGESLLLGK